MIRDFIRRIEQQDLQPGTGAGAGASLTDVVYTTGNQFIFGEKTFIDRPLVNSTGVMLSGDLFASEKPDALLSTEIGGALPATAQQWETKTVNQILDAILFKDTQPTYTIPTFQIYSSQSAGPFEVGQAININTSATGVKNDAGGWNLLTTFTRNLNGVSNATSANQALIQTTAANLPASADGSANPNNPNFTYSATWTQNNVTLQVGAYTWFANLIGGYSAGLPKKTSSGVDDIRPAALRSVNARQAAQTGNTFATNTVSLNAIYPYFYGKSASPITAAGVAGQIQLNTATKVLANSNGNITVSNFGASSEYIWIAFPASQASSVPLKTRWDGGGTSLNQGTIGAGQVVLAPVLVAVNSPNGLWNNINYYVYISRDRQITLNPWIFSE